jgi:D-glycero-D-manno-heptose 1,7-bisphosphate phosphatase
MIGDKAIDVECGLRAGCQTILVRTGYGANLQNTGANFVHEGVVTALERISALSLG